MPTLLGAQKASYVKFGETDLGGSAWLLYIVMAAAILIPAFYLIREPKYGFASQQGCQTEEGQSFRGLQAARSCPCFYR